VVRHAKSNNSSNNKVATNATIKSLRAQVQQLEKHANFSLVGDLKHYLVLILKPHLSMLN